MQTVRCYDCGRSFPFDERKRCACGEALWFALEAVEWPARPDPGMWRYLDLLPTNAPSGVGAAAGGTPVVRAPRLDVGGVRLHLKDEGQNPTGSFKDRGSAVGAAPAAERGIDRVGTVSHGNMAMSMAANAAGSGLDCTVLVPADIPEERLSHIARYDRDLVRVEGDYGQLYEESLNIEGIEFVNSDTPLRIAGQKTVAYEICEAFSPEVPDAIVLPVSSGGQLSAIWKALRELRRADLLDSLPRLYATQAAACDPIVRACGAGEREVSAISGGETIAYSIANANPPSGNRALAALRDTGGGAVSVPDEETRSAQRRLAREGGFRVEAPSAVAYAGLERLAERGEIRSDERVVAILTGSGFKESSDVAVNAETVGLENLKTVL